MNSSGQLPCGRGSSSVGKQPRADGCLLLGPVGPRALRGGDSFLLPFSRRPGGCLGGGGGGEVGGSPASLSLNSRIVNRKLLPQSPVILVDSEGSLGF